MNSKFKISIPKPCHENWNKMSPKEKGRFCSSCAKTVVDFTKKSTTEIQDYLIEHKNKRVCGHFYKKQLDTIVIEIPQITFQQQLSYQKLFILALFFVMGTTLFSCQYSDGKKQKIENVIIKDSIKIIEEDLGVIFPIENSIDSLKLKKDEFILLGKIEPLPKPTTGDIICEPNLKKDSIIEIKTITTGDTIEITETEGDIILEEVIIMGDIRTEEPKEPFSFYYVDIPPKFKEAKKEGFDERMKKFVQESFDKKMTKNLNLSVGKYKIFTQFIIDKEGNVIYIKVRAPHPKLKDEVIKMLKKLPQFIPGKQAGKVVKTKYTLPISFEVD
jgi:hypothetical protein